MNGLTQDLVVRVPVQSISQKNGEKRPNKAPPIQKQKCAPNILEEDTYQQAISDIIKRDFFPDLLEMEANEKMQEQGLEMAENMGSGDAAKNTSKPGENTRYTHEETASSELTRNMSLDQFQAKYTSEDNASFIDILNEQNQRQRDAYDWAWNNNKINTDRVNEESRRALLKSSNVPQIGWVDDRPSQPEAWPFNPMNALMFHPETDHTKPKILPLGFEKSITYHATRMPPAQFSRPASPSTGTASNLYDEPLVAGWGFVDEPSPSPLLSNSRTPTSRLPQTPRRAFKMPDIPHREALHHRITDQLKKKKTKTPIPSLKKLSTLSTPDLRMAMLSPGGRLLLAASGRHTSLRNDLKTPRMSSLLANSSSDFTPRAA
ncbi:uncharacterized protein T551_02706 [Pneumocystis jirovecii RU7]|uniref:Uncharacterized protein n=1 Tax=Pneumocystis jirovecii (strain RU7) TaxID=1408657 RepID=A0A0W4ZIT8_PNEJ7|nr:uncharacterized protein T551_02706 [Pneumocystis jirovecii RU7]KTW28287.1 hypothetical protein T551_02706 [Pneumocystis jirovecii RU7]